MRWTLTRKTDFESSERSTFYSVASRPCFLAAFLLQKNLERPCTSLKYFQKLIFSLTTLEMGKCLQRCQPLFFSANFFEFLTSSAWARVIDRIAVT